MDHNFVLLTIDFCMHDVLPKYILHVMRDTLMKLYTKINDHMKKSIAQEP